MFKGDWRLYAAFGIIVGVIALGILGRQWDGRHYYEAAEPHYTIPDSGAAITDAPTAFYQGDNTRQSEEATPDQNTRTVWAAEDAAYWTMATAVIGGLGTLIVGFSLIFSAGATKAALDAAKYTKDTLHNSRAWLLVSVVDPTFGRNMRQRDGSIINLSMMARIVWKNCGPTPAIKVNMVSQMDIIPRDDPIPNFDIDVLPGDFVVAPNGETGTNFAGLNDAQTQNIRAGTHIAIIYSKIVYFDIFNPTQIRVSEGCHRIHISGQTHGRNGELIDAVFSGPVGPQNGAT